MAASQGFEPRFKASKAPVLPLDELAKGFRRHESNVRDPLSERGQDTNNLLRINSLIVVKDGVTVGTKNVTLGHFYGDPLNAPIIPAHNV